MPPMSGREPSPGPHVLGVLAEPPPLFGPDLRGPRAVWSGRLGEVHLRFVGDGPRTAPAELLRSVESGPGGVGEPPAAAWLRQVHSGRVLEAREPGPVGEADALWTRRPGLALAVVTADCVPVLLSAREPGRIRGGHGGRGGASVAVAAVHAGWRGIEAGVVPRAVAAVRAAADGGEAEPADRPSLRILAWIGPAIGACCYEVGEDVAERVAAVAGAEHVVPPGEGPGRPHLDLPGAVRSQLVAAGVPAPRVLVRCTRCDRATLASYRREGEGAGRNVSFVWIAPGG